ncbi:hypothetical protein VYU27_000021 [Nannochloropsis oceanica]
MANTTVTIRKRLLPRVAVGLSGGVDSSVAAMLLLQQGYEVVGVHMQNWDTSDEEGMSACPETEDLKDAQEVSKQLGIPFYRADFSRPYWTNVFTPFLEDYERGWTPNPDVLCNREIKFSKFRNFAQEALRTPWVATGHYARLRYPCPPSLPPSSEAIGAPQLLVGVDDSKDQSYFLSHVPSLAFQHTLFPLGHLTKTQVRALATNSGLCTAQKKESMGICFVGKRRMGDFLPEYLKPLPGLLVSVTDGAVLGEQEGGLTLLTVGQGARIGGEATKWFVCGKDMEKGVVWVAPGTNHPALYCDWLLVKEEKFNWIGRRPRELQRLVREDHHHHHSSSSSNNNNNNNFNNNSNPSSRIPVSMPFRCEYRVRYRQPLASCTVSLPPSAPGLLRIDFDAPQRAVALKQTLALYDGERCLGGGVIVGVGPSYWERGKELPEERVEWAV